MSFVARPDSSPKWADDLPEGWTADWVKWSVAFASAKPDGEDIEKLPYISNEDIASWTGRLLKEDPEPADKEGRLFRRDDVLFNKLRPYLAKVYHADFDGISSGELLNLRASERVLPRFLFHLLSSYPFVDIINSESFGTKMPRADWEIVGHQPLPLPDLDTQRRIAGYLDNKTRQIDALIEKKRALLDRLSEKRQALITRAVTRGLNLDVPLKDSGSKWLGNIPEHWAVRPLKWRVRVQSGQVDPVADEFKSLPLIAPDHIEQRTGRIVEVRTADEQSAMSGKYLCAPTAVLYSKIRPALRKAAVFGNECLCSADMYALNPGDEVMRDYLLFFLLTEAFSAYAELSSLRVAMPKVNREALGVVEICIPPLDEQRAIASYCSEENSKHLVAIDTVEQSVERLIEYRAALVTSAVKGEMAALL
ncbi:restriction endonuclease subunit S [Ruegeria sp. HKCCA6707]|uniref:restriction endonuclease subunit S n=1 Tax=Ruegeria sp. HKCCA6707 TaxID=2682996 RepID=UPI001488F43B|nr:restriction endonuclease subunit S [Ruegeria sp. HKCCA6707]